MTSTLSSVEPRHAHAVSERGFLAASALLFIASAAATVAWCHAMPAMADMPIAWMPMCGQTWWSFAASFVGMWTVMMTAMMLPSLLPMLRLYRAALRAAGESSLGAPTALAGAGYFAVWAVIGVAVFALGVALATAEMTWPVLVRAVSAATGPVVFAAGALQSSVWKERQLARCRQGPASGVASPRRAPAAWQYGLHLGMRCVRSCVSLSAILLVMGVMDLRAMVAMSVAIALERLAPHGDVVARGIGVIAMGAGLLLMLGTTSLT